MRALLASCCGTKEQEKITDARPLHLEVYLNSARGLFGTRFVLELEPFIFSFGFEQVSRI